MMDKNREYGGWNGAGLESGDQRQEASKPAQCLAVGVQGNITTHPSFLLESTEYKYKTAAQLRFCGLWSHTKDEAAAQSCSLGASRATQPNDDAAARLSPAEQRRPHKRTRDNTVFSSAVLNKISLFLL